MIFKGIFKEDARTLDPARAADPASVAMVSSLFEPLFQYAYASQDIKVEPLLAADQPTVSKDRLTVTIRVRNDVRYRDDICFRESSGKGRHLVARDLAYAIQRVAQPDLESPGWWLLDGKIRGLNELRAQLEVLPKELRAKAVLDAQIEGLETPDPQTLRIRLTQPFPQLLHVLAQHYFSAVAPECVIPFADSKGEVQDRPVGTGPFQLRRWRRGKKIELERNPGFHTDFYPISGSEVLRAQGYLADGGKPLPFLEGAVFEVVRDRLAGWDAFLARKVDATSIPRERFGSTIIQEVNLNPELTSKGVRLVVEPSLSFYYLAFSMNDPLLGSKKGIRQALAAAVDHAHWILTFTGGAGRQMRRVLLPTVVDADPAGGGTSSSLGSVGATSNSAARLKRAADLLARAGYPGGKGLPPLQLDMRGSDELNHEFAERFARDLAQVGVRLAVTYNSFDDYLEKAKAGKLQISYGGWALDYPDPVNGMQLLYGPNRAPGPNEANFDNPEFNRLFQRLLYLDAGPARAQVVRAMEQIVADEAPWAFGYVPYEYRLHQPWVFNFRALEVYPRGLKFFRVDPEIRKRYLEARP